MKRFFGRLAIGVMLAAALLPAATVTVTGAEDRSQLTDLEPQIRKELITLPFYDVFDYFEFDVGDDAVILRGQVFRPSLKRSAERAVDRVAAGRRIENRIEILPTSPHDDLIRRSLARAIYGDSILNRYAAGANPWIRLIVRDGDVTLEGYVDREMDRNIALIRAGGVHGAFSVTDRLMIKTT
jgi:hypothetical protein